MIKVTFVYSEANYFLHDNYSDKVMYHFFMKRLKQHPELDVTYVQVAGDKPVDCSQFKNQCDVFLFYSPHIKFNPILQNLRSLDIPKFAMSGDSHNYYEQKEEMNLYGDDINYFFTNTPGYFYRYIPRRYKYRQIIIGTDPDEGAYYMVPEKEFHDRIGHSILNTGLINVHHHLLRKKCNDLECVEYIPKGDYVGDRFSLLLIRYQAAIAAATMCFTFKYFEICLAGCVPFLEVNDQNGAKDLGFVDGKTAVFINEHNYVNKLTDYMYERNDPAWEIMAKKAREFVLNNYTVPHGVKRLVNYMKESL